MAVDLSSGPQVVVLNPYGAAWVYTKRIVYSSRGHLESLKAEHQCGKPLLRVERADYVFEPMPPPHLEGWEGSSATLNRDWLNVTGGVEDCIAEYSASGALNKAILLATIDLVPTTEASVLRLERLQAQVLSPSNGDLDPEASAEMRANIRHYDPFGMISARAGWPTATAPSELPD